MNTKNLPEAGQSRIESLVRSWVADEKMFTKYDVTKQLRHDGFFVKHNDVRTVIDSMVISDDYSQEMIRIQNRPVIVFFPDHLDASDYDPDEVVAYTGTLDSQDDGTSSSTTSTSTTTKKKNLYDLRGRYSVQVAIVRGAGYDAGSRLTINVESGKIVIDSDMNSGRPITVDMHSIIRVPKSDFENAFDTIPNKISVAISKGKIEITEN